MWGKIKRGLKAVGKPLGSVALAVAKKLASDKLQGILDKENKTARISERATTGLLIETWLQKARPADHTAGLKQIAETLRKGDAIRPVGLPVTVNVFEAAHRDVRGRGVRK